MSAEIVIYSYNETLYYAFKAYFWQNNGVHRATGSHVISLDLPSIDLDSTVCR